MTMKSASPGGKKPGALKRASKYAIWFALAGVILGLLNSEQLGLVPTVLLTTICTTAFGVTLVTVIFAARNQTANPIDDPNEDAFDDG